MVGSVIGESWFIFAHPAWLAAMPTVAMPVLLAWPARRRGRRIPAPAVAAQCLALALLVTALAQPMAAIGEQADLPYLLLRDTSGSVRGQEQTVRQLVFPAGADVERFAFADGIARGQTPHADATRITPPLRLIASRGPNALSAAIIVTDGRFSHADYTGPAKAVADLGAEVFVVPLDAPPADARIAALTVRRASATQAEITTVISSNAPLKRTLTITRRGHAEPLVVRQLSLPGNSPITVRITDPVASDAAAEYSARLTGDTVITENDSASAMVLPVRQVIAAVGTDQSSKTMLDEIRLPITFISHNSMSADAAAMGRFSAVIVADPTGSSLTAAQRRALARYVRTGGGLVLIGTGPHETPADRNGPLNRVLPLVANPFERRPLHLVVLLDKSGSMAQTTSRTAARMSSPKSGGSSQIKFDLAAEAVAALKDHLTTRDTLTVIAFAEKPDVVYDSGASPGDFAALRKATRRVRPAGSTRVTPAITLALRKAPPTGRKTMLLIVSDLKTEQFNPAEWAEAFRRANAGLAVVAIRADSPAPTTAPAAPLKTLAGLLDAPYVERDRLTGLAEVFAKLVRRGRGGVLRKGRTGLSVPAALFDTALTTLPDIEAYILSASRKRAEVLAFTTGGDPILGKCRAGLGRSVCLAVPVSDTINTAWAGTPAAAKLVAAAVRRVLRSTNDPRFDAKIKRHGEQIEITLTATDKDAPVNGLDLSAELAGGDRTQTANFDQVAPGRYRARADWPADLPAAVAVRDEKGVTVWRSSANVLYPNEYRSLGADYESLRRLARLTGGRIVPAGQLGDALKRSYRRRMTILWPWLIASALALMLGEWCLARITRR